MPNIEQKFMPNNSQSDTFWLGVFVQEKADQIDILQTIAAYRDAARIEHSAPRKIVQGLAQQTLLDLARIWLLQPDAPDQMGCLYLAASDGKSIEKRRESGALNCLSCTYSSFAEMREKLHHPLMN
jgi:hypothetical protein